MFVNELKKIIQYIGDYSLHININSVSFIYYF